MQHSAKEKFNFSVTKAQTRIYSNIAGSKWRFASFNTYCKSDIQLLW